MARNLTVLDGNTFFVSDAAGDVEPGEDANGFFHADMRQLSTWRLRVNRQPVHRGRSERSRHRPALMLFIAGPADDQRPVLQSAKTAHQGETDG